MKSSSGLYSKSSNNNSYSKKNNLNYKNPDTNEQNNYMDDEMRDNNSRFVRIRNYLYKKCLSLFSFKILIIASILLLMYLFNKPLISQFYNILYQYPPLASFFSEILREWSQKTLRGLLFIGFFSTLFIVSIPSELLFLQYLVSGNNILLVIVILVIANSLAMFVNYIIGLIVGRKLIKLWLKEKFYKYEGLINKWGGSILIIGNIVPSPIEFVSIIYGTSRYPLIKYIYFIAISRAIRYSILLYIFTFYPQYISVFAFN